MTLNEFKEKLFKKANEMSVEMAYNGFTYRIAYRFCGKCNGTVKKHC